VEQTWHGDERRGIPIHILNHVDERLGQHSFRIEKLLMDHTDDEMERYQEIISRIDRNSEDSQRRHEATAKAIVDHMSKTDMIYEHLIEAFPPDDRGKPDFIGHATAHKKWITEAKDTKELRAYIQKVVLAAATVGVAGWLLSLAWQGFLMGPK